MDLPMIYFNNDDQLEIEDGCHRQKAAIELGGKVIPYLIPDDDLFKFQKNFRVFSGPI